MSGISVWFIRAALVHFALGTTVGAWQLGEKSGLVVATAFSARSAHVELLLLGWVCQLAFGVALWILPFSRGVSEGRWVWWAWGALNLGIVAVVGAKIGQQPLVVVGGRLLEIGAGLLVVWGLWERVRALPRRPGSG